MTVNINAEIIKIEKRLLKYAFRQSRRFFLQGDIISNAEDLVSSAFTKFFNRFIHLCHIQIWEYFWEVSKKDLHNALVSNTCPPEFGIKAII